MPKKKAIPAYSYGEDGGVTIVRRRQRAKDALKAYRKATSTPKSEDDATVATDLIADVLHLLAASTVDDSDDEATNTEAVIERVLRMAKTHFDAEHTGIGL